MKSSMIIPALALEVTSFLPISQAQTTQHKPHKGHTISIEQKASIPLAVIDLPKPEDLVLKTDENEASFCGVSKDGNGESFCTSGQRFRVFRTDGITAFSGIAMGKISHPPILNDHTIYIPFEYNKFEYNKLDFVEVVKSGRRPYSVAIKSGFNDFTLTSNNTIFYGGKNVGEVNLKSGKEMWRHEVDPDAELAYKMEATTVVAYGNWRAVAIGEKVRVWQGPGDPNFNSRHPKLDSRSFSITSGSAAVAGKIRSITFISHGRGSLVINGVATTESGALIGDDTKWLTNKLQPFYQFHEIHGFTTTEISGDMMLSCSPDGHYIVGSSYGGSEITLVDNRTYKTTQIEMPESIRIASDKAPVWTSNTTFMTTTANPTHLTSSGEFQSKITTRRFTIHP